MISPSQTQGASPEFFAIQVVNDGFRDVMLQGIAGRLRGIRPQVFLVVPPVDAHSTQLPAKLSYGEQANFLFPTSTFNENAIDLLSRIYSSWFPSISVRLLRVGVFATTGPEFLAPLDERVRHWLLARAKMVSA